MGSGWCCLSRLGVASGSCRPQTASLDTPWLPRSPSGSTADSLCDVLAAAVGTLGWSKRCLSGSCPVVSGEVSSPLPNPEAPLQAAPGEGLSLWSPAKVFPFVLAHLEMPLATPLFPQGSWGGGAPEKAFGSKGAAVPHPGPRTLGTLALACLLVGLGLESPQGSVLILG